MGILDIFQNTFNIAEKKISIKQFNDTAINDYFRTYLFDVTIMDTDVTSAEIIAQSLGLPFTSKGFQCEWVATTATPVMVTSTQNIDYMHTQIKQAGRTTPQQWQVTIRDDSKGLAFKYFNDWKNTVYPKITSNSTKRYKKTANLRLIHPTGSSNHRLYKISGVWPYEIGAIALDYDVENISVFPVTLSIDYFTIEGVGI